MKRIALLLLLVSSVSVHAFENCTIDPASGPTTGGNTVTIRCPDLGDWPYGVVFGETAATTTDRVDATTLTAIAPAHLPGAVSIRLFEYDIFRGTNLKYTFVGEIPEQMTRFLLPIFIPPVEGAFGSQFITDFRARAEGFDSIQLYGVHEKSHSSESPLELGHAPNGYQPRDILYAGQPGRFFYVKSEDANDFSASLHVYDTSRGAEHRGTQIPIVREDAFDTRLLLLGVPTDPRYRNTLRIYGTEPTAVTVRIGDAAPISLVVPGTNDPYQPSYAQFTAFPVGGDPVDVKIDAPVPVWAFVSTTNNDTQLITTITP